MFTNLSFDGLRIFMHVAAFDHKLLIICNDMREHSSASCHSSAGSTDHRRPKWS